VDQLNRLASSRIITDDDWEEFKRLYTQVYPSFFIRLKEKFPSITQAELRLAALLKLRLNNKEVASILAISADSVKKSRQRLRKRFGIPDERTALETFVEQVVL
jgi:hypothetical protein